MSIAAHRLDDIPCRETTATAADNDASGKFICLEGSRCLTVIETDRYVTAPLSVKTTRHEVNILRWQKLNGGAEGRLIAGASGQYVDVFAVGNNNVKAVNSVRAHPLNVTDLDWCAYDANLFVTSTIDDTINIWDMRELRKASLRLNVVAGAEQVKWAPNVQFYLCTAHGTDIRLWDIRNVSSPLQSIPAHLQKMCCVVWHPIDPYCFVTTSTDGYIKMWNFGDLTKPRHSIGVLPAPVWKLKFSFDGEEFASIPLPQRGIQSSKNTLNVWRTGELDNAQAMKCDDDVMLDVCWQKSQSRRRSFKYLYSISRSGKLRRYPLSPHEITTNSMIDITTPIAVDPMGYSYSSLSMDYDFINSNLLTANAMRGGLLFSNNNGNGTMVPHRETSDGVEGVTQSTLQKVKIGSKSDPEIRSIATPQTAPPSKRESGACQAPPPRPRAVRSGVVPPPPPSHSIVKTHSYGVEKTPLVPGHLPPSGQQPLRTPHHHQHTAAATAAAAAAASTSATPRAVCGSVAHVPHSSATVDGWKLWMSVPKLEGDSVEQLKRSELDALRNLGTQGLFTDRIDFGSAKVQLSYVHYASNNKLRLIVQLHPNYAANRRVCVEIVEGESSLERGQAIELLELLNKEAAGYVPSDSNAAPTVTLLAYTLKKLPKVIEQMEVFLPKSIAIPRVRSGVMMNERRGGCVSAEAGPGHVVSRSVGNETPKAFSLKPGSISPSQFRQIFDKWVPSPRTCGAVFNGSGLFVVFGPVTVSPKRRDAMRADEEPVNEVLKWMSSENMTLNIRRSRSSRRLSRHSACGGDTREKDNGTPQGTPRSLDDYNQGLLAAFSSQPDHPRCILPQHHLTAPQLNPSTDPVHPHSHQFQVSVLPPHVTPIHHAHSYSQSTSPNQSAIAIYRQFVNTTGLIGGGFGPQRGAHNEPFPLGSQFVTPKVTAESGAEGVVMGGVKLDDDNNNNNNNNNNQINSCGPYRMVAKLSAPSAPSAKSRSFSMQNVPLSLIAAHRNRGNSLTGVLADDHYRPADGVPHSTVTIYDVCSLMTVSKSLARKYRLVGQSAAELCVWNRKMAEEENRKDLVKVWQIIELCVRSRAARSRKKRHHRGHSWKSGECRARDGSEGSDISDGERSGDNGDGDNNDNVISDMIQCPWAIHPFGRTLVNSLLDYFGRINDYQTAAMIICVLSERIKRDFDAMQTRQRERNYQLTSYSLRREPRRVIQHTRSNSNAEITGGVCTASGGGGTMVAATPTRDNHRKMEEGIKAVLIQQQLTTSIEKENRPTTLSAECESEGALEAHSPPGRLASFFSSARPKLSRRLHLVSDNEVSAIRHVGSSARLYAETPTTPRNEDINNISISNGEGVSNSVASAREAEKYMDRLLDPQLSKRFDAIRHQYGDLLFRWRMYSKCNEVMKYSQNAPVALPLWTRSKCARCGHQCERGFCAHCSAAPPPLLCALCQMPVKGLLTSCAMCHHGGHSEHIVVWFISNSTCPCGCGCECKATGF